MKTAGCGHWWVVAQGQKELPKKKVLLQVVRENLAPFLATAAEAERAVPRFVVRAFEDLLACGDPRRGFVRCVCDGCGHQELVPFACRRRAPCPSCGGRRMAEIAMHWVHR